MDKNLEEQSKLPELKLGTMKPTFKKKKKNICYFTYIHFTGVS